MQEIVQTFCAMKEEWQLNDIVLVRDNLLLSQAFTFTL